MGENAVVDNPAPSRRHSLRWRLSWLFAATAVLTVSTFGLLVYRVAYSLAVDSAEARLRSVAVQLMTIVDLGLVNQIESLEEASQDPDVRAALQRSDADLVRTADRMRRLQGTAGNSVIVELRNASGEPVVMVPPGAVRPQDPAEEPDWSAPMVGPMLQRGDVTWFSAGAPVEVEGQPLGHLIVTRQLGVGTANRRIIANQLGDDALLLAGNRDGELRGAGTTVRYPGQPDQAITYERDGQRWVSVSEAVARTPWLYAVELPEHVAVASARALILPVGLIGLVIALAAAAVGARVSRRITTPLEGLTNAAEGMARGGRHIALVGTDRPDEIGRLARAFDTMLASVRTMRDQLEADVDARTVELTDAVTRLRQLDIKLRKSERLAVLGQSSGNVGHELRNPLGVMSTVVVLIDGLADASPKLKSYASLLREQIRLSERIISDMLDRARSGTPQLGEVDVRALLDDVVRYADIPDAVALERRYGEELPCVVVDRDHLRQIVWNLLSNGVQAMHGAGTLALSATHHDGRLRVEVRDSGPGVLDADAERIFEPMVTTRSEGVGLGLAISRAIARANGGDLVLSNPGEPGAVFVLDLPAAPCGKTAR